MAYKEITSRNSPNFTSGRQGKKIDKIVIHWWGDPNTKPSTLGVVNVLCNPSRQASAHFVVSGTNREVYQIVNDKDTAWHAGDWNTNLTSLGIECDPRCRNEDYDVIAEVIADLWKYYGKLPLYPHKKFMATRCPGNYDLNRLAKLAEEKLNPKPKPNIVTKEETKTEVIAFSTEKKEDPTLPKGENKIITIGVNGKKTTVYTVTYTNGKETKRVAKSSSKVDPITEVVLIGTKVDTLPDPEPIYPNWFIEFWKQLIEAIQNIFKKG